MPVGSAKQIVELKSPDHVGDSRVDDFIALAKLTVGETIFGTRFQYALALVVLHMLTLDAQGGGSSGSSGSGVIGGIKSEKEGDLQRSYGTVNIAKGTMTDAYFSSTPFGQEYLNLKRIVVIGVRNRYVGTDLI